MNTVHFDPDVVLVCIIALVGFMGIILMCFVFAICLRIVRGGSRRKRSKSAEADETKMIQEIYQGLSKMENRIDSLETLLLSKEERWAEKQKMHEFEQCIHKG
jgi:phage shock protein B